MILHSAANINAEIFEEIIDLEKYNKNYVICSMQFY
jgi:hypothetical protein